MPSNLWHRAATKAGVFHRRVRWLPFGTSGTLRSLSVSSSSSSSTTSTSPKTTAAGDAIPLTPNDEPVIPPLITTSSKTPPRPVFPWRHSADPLPRLTPNTRESQQDLVFTPGGHALLHALFLTPKPTPIRNCVFSFATYAWREDLAQSAGWAFCHALGELLQHSHNVQQPVVAMRNPSVTNEDNSDMDSSKEDGQEKPEIQFVYTPDTDTKEETTESLIQQDQGNQPQQPEEDSSEISGAATTDTENSLDNDSLESSTETNDATDATDVSTSTKESSTSSPASEPASKQTSSSSTTSKNTNTTTTATTTASLTDMVAPPLCELYESAHRSGKDQLRIRLDLIPTGRCVLHSLFGFPFVTRKTATEDPVIRQALTDFTKARIAGKSSPHAVVNELYQYLMNQHFDQHEGAEKHVFDTTVDLQVMVECDEVFGVWDATTGVLLQGTDGTTRQRVWHLVRMETCISTTVRQPPNAFLPTWSSEFRDPWQLTDIDDLLGPTTWYHGSVD